MLMYANYVAILFADENTDFFPKLKSLVEKTYEMNQKKRVMLLAHSLGNLYVLYFLKMMTPQWKKKYVRSYVAVSAPIGGSVKPLLLETYGKTWASAHTCTCSRFNFPDNLQNFQGFDQISKL